jgi:hypothetical protein
MKLSFEISDEAWAYLQALEGKSAEYRDTKWETLEDFRNSQESQDGLRTEEWFLNRNHGGTLNLAHELADKGLIDNDFDAWHLTYIVSPFGQEILEGNR